MAPVKSFWSDGIRFECQGSGHCCTAREDYGYVYLVGDDAGRLARHLGLSVDDLVAKHCQVTGGYLHLRDPQLDCCFLSTQRRCTVYDARPVQCRTWPFWAENLATPEIWNRDVVRHCPGVGRGALHTSAEIEEILAIQAEAEDEDE